MKILYVHSSADLYGADRCLLSIARGLIARGSEIHVAVPEDGPLVRELRQAGVRVVFLEPVVFRRDVLSPRGALGLALQAPVSIWKLYRLMRRERYGLVHSNTSVTLGGAIAAWLSGTPHVWHFREIQTEFGIMLRLYEPVVRLLSTRLIFITQAVAEQFRDARIRAKGKVIHDGIPVQEYGDLAGEPGSNGSVVVTSIGRLAPYKGQDVLVRALAGAAGEGVDLEAFIVGDVYADRHAYRMELIELAARLGMEDRIHFVGFHEEIQPYLERCNIFVMPANRQEPLGIVMLEAMAASRAVIATNGGGVAEIVKDGETGILVQVGDDRGMAAAIVSLARDPEKRRRLAQRGHEIVRQRFSEEAMLAEIAGIYQEVTGEPV
ncbi:MAG: glycosyltransferase [Thermoleophilia bacterium]